MSPPNDRSPKDLQALKADWVSKVVRDPAKPAGAQTVTGYLGDSHRDGHVRLYADAELSSYLDIPAGDVLHGQRLPEAQSPLGEVILWVRREAAFLQGAESATAAGSWFEGPVVSDQYAAAAAAFGGAGFPEGFPGGPVTFAPGCGPLLTIPPQCPLPTATTACCPVTLRPWCPPPTLPPGCPPPTFAPRCPPTVFCPRTPVRPCITQLPLCRTVIDCPVKSQIVACPSKLVVACTVRTPVINCPSMIVLCQTPLCPRESAICPRTQTCPNSFICTAICPSVVDGCPSAPGGCDWTTVINPGETVVNTGVFNPAGMVINPGGWTGGMYGY